VARVTNVDADQPNLFHDLEYLRWHCGYRGRFEGWQPILFLKSHELPDVLFGNSPELSGRFTDIIELVRHPLDVCTSTLRYLIWSKQLLHEGCPLVSVDEARVMGVIDHFIDGFLELGGYRDFLDAGYGTWPQHVEAWTSRGGAFAVHFACYHALCDDPVTMFSDLLQRLHFDVSRRDVERAVALVSPGYISTMLGKGFALRASDHTYDDVLSPEQIARGLSVFNTEIERYGL
jgi:hypothetical protein